MPVLHALPPYLSQFNYHYTSTLTIYRLTTTNYNTMAPQGTKVVKPTPAPRPQRARTPAKSKELLTDAQITEQTKRYLASDTSADTSVVDLCLDTSDDGNDSSTPSVEAVAKNTTTQVKRSVAKPSTSDWIPQTPPKLERSSLEQGGSATLFSTPPAKVTLVRNPAVPRTYIPYDPNVLKRHLNRKLSPHDPKVADKLLRAACSGRLGQESSPTPKSPNVLPTASPKRKLAKGKPSSLASKSTSASPKKKRKPSGLSPAQASSTKTPTDRFAKYKAAVLQRHPQAASLLEKARKLVHIRRIAMRFDSAGTKPRIKTFPEDNVPDAGATSSALSEVALTKLAATSSSAPANYRPQRAQSTNDDHQLLSSTNEANEYHHLTDLSGLKVGMANIITICKAIGATLTSKHGNTYRQAMVEDGFGNSKRLVAFGPVGCDKIGTMQVGSVCKLHKVKVSRGKETYTTDNACVNELQINAFIAKDFMVEIVQASPSVAIAAKTTGLLDAQALPTGTLVNVTVQVFGRSTYLRDTKFQVAGDPNFIQKPPAHLQRTAHLMCLDSKNIGMVLCLSESHMNCDIFRGNDCHNYPFLLQAQNVLVTHDGSSTHLLAVPLTILTDRKGLNAADQAAAANDPFLQEMTPLPANIVPFMNPCIECPEFLVGEHNDNNNMSHIGNQEGFSLRMLTAHAFWWPLVDVPTSTLLDVKNATDSPHAVSVFLNQVSVSKTLKGALSVGLQVEDDTCTLWVNAYNTVLMDSLHLSTTKLEALADSGELSSVLQNKAQGRLILRLRLLPRPGKLAHICVQEVHFAGNTTNGAREEGNYRPGGDPDAFVV